MTSFIHRPPLLCVPNRDGIVIHKHSHNPKTIGKQVFDRGAMVTEVFNNHLMAAIDPHNSFTVKYHGAGWVGTTDRSVQLIFDDGGFSLKEYRDAPHKWPNVSLDHLLVGAVGIMHGIVAMQQINVCHLDIKPPNLVFDPVIQKLSLIDFGLMSEFSNIKTNSVVMQYSYPYYPPEMLVISSLINDQTTDAESILDRFRGAYYKQTRKYMGFNMDWMSQPGIEEWPGFVRGIDSFSLAFTLLELCAESGAPINNQEFVHAFLHTVILPLINLNPVIRPTIQNMIVIAEDLVSHHCKHQYEVLQARLLESKHARQTIEDEMARECLLGPCDPLLLARIQHNSALVRTSAALRSM